MTPNSGAVLKFCIAIFHDVPQNTAIIPSRLPGNVQNKRHILCPMKGRLKGKKKRIRGPGLCFKKGGPWGKRYGPMGPGRHGPHDRLGRATNTIEPTDASSQVSSAMQYNWLTCTAV